MEWSDFSTIGSTLEFCYNGFINFVGPAISSFMRLLGIRLGEILAESPYLTWRTFGALLPDFITSISMFELMLGGALVTTVLFIFLEWLIRIAKVILSIVFG